MSWSYSKSKKVKSSDQIDSSDLSTEDSNKELPQENCKKLNALPANSSLSEKMKTSQKCANNPKENAFWMKMILDIRVKVICVVVLVLLCGVCVPYFVVFQFNRLKNESSVTQGCILEHELRIDCLPGITDENQTQAECEKLHCCWDDFGPPIPTCFHPHPTKYTYDTQVVKYEKSGYQLQLRSNFENTSFNAPAKDLVAVHVEFWSDSHLRILIDGGAHFNPLDHVSYADRDKSRNGDENYEVVFAKTGRFHLQVYRRKLLDKGHTAIFNTYYGPFIVSEGFTEITTMLPSFNLYGIGQARKSTFRHDLKYLKKYELFSRLHFMNGTTSFLDTPTGVHPFYMVMEDDGNAHGVFLVTSLPTEIVTSGIPSVTFRTMDTRLDIHLFLGPTPTDVIKQLTDYVGKPAMPPYWGLGYHSCRLTSNWNDSTTFIRFTSSKRIPHESDCGSSKLFAIGESTDMRNNVTDFLKELEISGRKFLVFLLPHVAVEKSAESSDIDAHTYQEAMEINKRLFVLDAATNEIFLGTLDNGLKMAYPDFFLKTGVKKWLENELKVLLDKSDFDGLLLHLNTPFNDNMQSPSTNATLCQNNRAKGFFSRTDYLNNHTICMDALHVETQHHLYFHNIYGYKHMISVKSALKSLKKFRQRRPLLSSMSTFLGSGTHGGYWGAMNNPSWQSLKETLVQMLDFSLFGIPFYGSPSCGVQGIIDAALCSRWFQLSAFQPFVFSHRTDNTDILSSNRRMISISRSMLQLRYSLLPYLYGLFYNATYRGETVIRPLFFEFPNIRETYGLDEQFMWGSSLLISPIMNSSSEKAKVFFPPGCWYDYYSGRKEAESSVGIYKEIASSDHHHHTNLHIRGGHVIPTQTSKLTTEESRKQNFTITIGFNCARRESGRSSTLDTNSTLAVGEIFIDDGFSEDSIVDGRFLLISLSLNGRVLSIDSNNDRNHFIPDNVSHILNTVHLYGVPERPSTFFVDECETPFVFNSVFQSATLDGLELNITEHHILRWEPIT